VFSRMHWLRNLFFSKTCQLKVWRKRSASTWPSAPRHSSSKAATPEEAVRESRRAFGKHHAGLRAQCRSLAVALARKLLGRHPIRDAPDAQGARLRIASSSARSRSASAPILLSSLLLIPCYYGPLPYAHPGKIGGCLADRRRAPRYRSMVQCLSGIRRVATTGAAASNNWPR